MNERLINVLRFCIDLVPIFLCILKQVSIISHLQFWIDFGPNQITILPPNKTAVLPHSECFEDISEIEDIQLGCSRYPEKLAEGLAFLVLDYLRSPALAILVGFSQSFSKRHCPEPNHSRFLFSFLPFVLPQNQTRSKRVFNQ